MAFNTRSLTALLALAPLLATAAKAQDVPADVKPDHWAYEAVSDLAKKCTKFSSRKTNVNEPSNVGITM